MKRLLSSLLLSSFCFSMVCYAQTVDTSVDDKQVEALIVSNDGVEETFLSKEISRAMEEVTQNKETDRVVVKSVQKVNEEPVMMPKYQKLYDTNNDTIGFIYLTDEYKYPILQRVSDQNYYLHKDFFGNEDKNGSIFANRFSELGQPGITLIYGHTMKSGKMFQGLKNYLDADYFEEHKIMQIDTLFDEMYYEVVAVAQTSMHEDFQYYSYVGDVSEKEFYEWRDGFEQYISRGSLSDLEYGDIVVELSCCAYHTKDGRLVVILKAVDSDAADL